MSWGDRSETAGFPAGQSPVAAPVAKAVTLNGAVCDVDQPRRSGTRGVCVKSADAIAVALFITASSFSSWPSGGKTPATPGRARDRWPSTQCLVGPGPGAIVSRHGGIDYVVRGSTFRGVPSCGGNTCWKAATRQLKR